MSDVIVTVLISLCVFAGALLGMFFNRVLPPDHVGEETRRVVNISVGLIATLSALVLGLLVASTKAAFDAKSDEIKQTAARIVLLDRTLRQYGPEAAPARAMLHDLTRRRMMLTWNEALDSAENDRLRAEGIAFEQFQTTVRLWKAGDDGQKWLQVRALNLSAEIEQTRWLLSESNESSIQRPFLIVLVAWLTVIFASIGMFAPRNRTAVVVIFVCALSVSAAIFLILEMDQAFDGLMMVSDSPLRSAYQQILR
ncbi:MAG: hypothetical protein ABI777_08490 [Betaproteobacteria bacterium]